MTNKIAVPKGFLFSTTEAAIKKPGRKDVALIFSEAQCVVSGMFTTNRIKAAPVRLDARRVRGGKGQAIIANSGNANACTGGQGMEDAVETARLVAHSLGISPRGVYVCSTGVIGTRLPMGRIRNSIAGLVEGLGRATVEDVAAAIMTTDTFPKVVSKQLRIGRKLTTIVGLCKGAGMISPHMATMLCFILTDAQIEKATLDAALSSAVQRSFNRITVDGDMSTNDTVLLMANGMDGNGEIKRNSTRFKTFSSALDQVTWELSRLIVKDGEGATKFVEIEIKRAKNDRDAEVGAFAIANSLLVKTALYGNDANWGRLMAVLGYAGIAIKEEKTDIFMNGLKVTSGGAGTGRDKDANELLKSKEIAIVIDLHLGKGKTKILTCDLTEGYVKINAEYRT